MANKVYNMAGGLHSAAAYSGWENELFGGNAVASSTALKVGAGSGMTVNVGKGNGLIDTGDDYARRVALTEPVGVTLDQADTSLPRNDLIVIYVDMAVAPVQTVQDNTNGILKVVAVKGTPAASPSDPDTGTIQQSIGAGNPYMILASIRVNAGGSAISAGNITDKRPTSPNVYLTTSDIQSIADQRIAVTDDFYQTTTTTVTPWSGVSLRITKWPRLRLAQAQLSGRYNNPPNTTISPAVVPAAYRPASESRTVGFIDGNCCTMSLNTDGTVFYWMKSGTGPSSEFNGSFVYKTAS